MKRLRLLTELPRYAASCPQPGWDEVYCPFLSGLPAETASFLALLPIQDANEVLLNGIADAPAWPAELWACVMAADPFRHLPNMLEELEKRGVRKICCYPSAALQGAEMSAAFDVFALGRKAEQHLEELARARGLAFMIPDRARWLEALLD